MRIKNHLFVATDYTELGIEKTTDVVVNSVKASGRGLRVSACRTKAAWVNHRTALGDRMLDRQISRQERKAAKNETTDTSGE